MQIETREYDFDNYLPHNFLAEKMVLSCLLTSSEAIEITTKNLSVEAFYFKNHQEFFKAILFMYQNNKFIDIITFTTFLQENGLINKIGGIKVLIELINQIPNIVYLDEYIRLIKDKFLRRSLIKLGYKTINSSFITNISLENILAEFESNFFKITNEFKPNKLSSSTDLVYSIFLDLKQKSTSPNLPGLISGFSALDSLTQGFQKSDLIIIAGRPSIGKTAFSLTITLNIIKYSKLPVLVFSLEMSKEQIMYRLLSMETNISQLRLRSGKLYEMDWIKLNKIIKILSKLPLFVDDSSDLSVQEIRGKIKTVISQYKTIGLVIIDYIQLMQNSISQNGNRAQELSQITRALKNVAKEFNIPIIALSQLSRNVENRTDKKPILSDLRESGSIEQDADLVLMLYQNDRTNSEQSFDNFNKIIDLIIAKQRNGPTGSIQLKFDKRRTKYLNI
jgi:replicative DNA helicase|uniref:DNA replication helicase n=1 Tax=Ulnaria ulna TaxID=426669 RepID=UPI0027A96AA2|nr:DNA replication helicase [Ulnaria ulna]WGN98746.1 DNA replication helicase [Ulnaria ulna]